MNYLKVGKASDLSGNDQKLYRLLEIIPGFLSWATLASLLVLSFFFPVFIAYFLIAFDIYWSLLVFFLGIHLVASYRKMKGNMNIDWLEKCRGLKRKILIKNESGEESEITLQFDDLIHLVILPVYNESYEVIKSTVAGLAESGYQKENLIIVLTIEERGGEKVREAAIKIKQEFERYFRNFLLTFHPVGLEGELKGKGTNQVWGAEEVKKEIIDREKIDYHKILVSVFDIDTVIYPQYFFVLAYNFFVAEKPYRSSYQPIPIYHNNVWHAPFFARVAASSNTFWQMMQQIRQEKLATYSSHSMTWLALVEIGFWSKRMVSEDSRIFWHCFCFYHGDYTTVPLYYPVSMDITMDKNARETAKNLYKQQRRWGWGVENIPYLIFNTIKQWSQIPKFKFLSRILAQVYGFHSWATNALIIAIIGWMPLLLGGDRFNSTVLSANLPSISRTLMTVAMGGLILSAILSTLLLPRTEAKKKIGKKIMMLLEWLILPVSIIVFGAIPGLEAQTRLMFGKYMGFWVTPKERKK